MRSTHGGDLLHLRAELYFLFYIINTVISQLTSCSEHMVKICWTYYYTLNGTSLCSILYFYITKIVSHHALYSLANTPSRLTSRHLLTFGSLTLQGQSGIFLRLSNTSVGRIHKLYFTVLYLVLTPCVHHTVKRFVESISKLYFASVPFISHHHWHIMWSTYVENAGPGTFSFCNLLSSTSESVLEKEPLIQSCIGMNGGL